MLILNWLCCCYVAKPLDVKTKFHNLEVNYVKMYVVMVYFVDFKGGNLH